MPFYDYRCQVCDETFELRRAAGDADRSVRCPAGHEAVTRLLPVFAATGRASASPSAGAAPGGGCCGGACGCH